MNIPGIDSTGNSGSISRRKFIAGTGALVGTFLAGSGLLSSCSDENAVQTITVTAIKPQFISPYDGKAFATFEELTSYIEQYYPGQQPVNRFISPYDGREFITLEEFKTHLDDLFGGTGFVTLSVNGRYYSLHVKANWALSFVLRERLGLTGTKIGCNRGSCGSCTVIMDGKAVFSCIVLAIEAGNKPITTIEGLSDGIHLHAVQQAFIDNDAVQCGYCTPGFIMCAKALLDKNTNPSVQEIREALSGNLCICGNTKKIVAAVASFSQGL